MDDRPTFTRSLGYLRIDGRGEIRSDDMREMLVAFEKAYAVVAGAELLIAERVVALRSFSRWSRRWGPPEVFAPLMGPFWTSQLNAAQVPQGPDVPLVVNKVVLRSPGFWEFMGSLNPLEVLRLYLNDRHERKKDDSYRSEAERERLAIERSHQALGVVEQALRIRREFREDFPEEEPDVLTQTLTSIIRPALERLAEFDDRGLISGESATTSREPHDRQ